MDALVLVNLQNDFLPGGVLAVPRGEEVIPVANALMPRFALAIAARDWHPANHGAFASQNPGKSPGDIVTLNGLKQTLVPEHCIQGSRGAAFPSALRTQGFHFTIDQGTDPTIDGYSALFDHGQKRETGLTDILLEKGVDTLYVMGLATEDCVKHTVMDARMLGYTVFLIADGCRGRDAAAPDEAIEAMRQLGVGVTPSGSLAIARAA